MKYVVAVLVFVGLMLLIRVVIADDFQWIVNCQQLDAGGRVEYWIGYSSSSEFPDSYFSYIGNGPGFFVDHIVIGIHEKQIEVLLPEDDSEVTIWLDPEHYEITINHDTVAPDCNAAQSHGDLHTITIMVGEGQEFTWEKMDEYGHWGSINGVVTQRQEENGVAFTRLVLGPDNQDTDPSHYRVTAK